MHTNFKFIGLTRLGIKPKSTAPEADALTTRSSELLIFNFIEIHVILYSIYEDIVFLLHLIIIN